MRVLVADALTPSFMEALRDEGWEATEAADLTQDSLPGAIGGYDALVVRSTRVTAETIAAADRLALIVRAGAGTNTIDVAAASNAAITVSNAPGQNAIAVAELTLALLLAIDRSVPDNVAALREGRWEKRRFSRARGLYGRTFGLVGLGSIGQEVAQRVAGFGMHIVTLDRPNRSPRASELLTRLRMGLVDSLEELAAASDVLSFHVPLSDATKGMINASLLSHLRAGAILLNTSRGELVADESDLVAAIDNRGLRVGVDVFHNEPGSGTAQFSSKFAQHPGVYGTHHIGASTEQAQEAVAAAVLEVLRKHHAGRPRNAVNLLEASAGASMVVRHHNVVGVLSAILAEVRRAGINVQDMENRIFAGGIGAVARLSLSAVPSTDTQNSIRALPQVVDLSVRGHE